MTIFSNLSFLYNRNNLSISWEPFSNSPVYLYQKRTSADDTTMATTMDVNHENQIIARVQSGHTEDFEQLVRRYQGALFRIVGNMIDPPHLLEDLVQEIFLAAFVHIKRFDPKQGAFRTWLFTIARNRTLNARRKKRESPMADTTVIPDRHTPADDLMTKEAFEHLDRALNSFKFQDRMIFILAEMEGLAYAEIARIENLPLGTVKSKLARIRAKLRQALTSQEAQPSHARQALAR